MKLFCKSFIVILIAIQSVILFAENVRSLELVDRWEFKQTPYGNVYAPGLIDSSDNVIIALRRSGIQMISKNRIKKIIPQGEGPNEIKKFRIMFNWAENEIALVEAPTKIKIFSAQNDNYLEKKQFWFQRDYFYYNTVDGLRYKDGFLFAGICVTLVKKKKAAYHVIAYNKQNKIEKRLVWNHKLHENKSPYEMLYFITKSDKRKKAYFMKENSLTVYPIDLETLSEPEGIRLKTPDFYKPEPPDCYVPDPDMSYSKLIKDKEKWRVAYSRIQDIDQHDDQLIVQIRTCDENRKKFALLFYNLENYKLEHIEFLDDFMLGIKDGKYYFFANGDPTLDDGTDTYKINVYQFKKKRR